MSLRVLNFILTIIIGLSCGQNDYCNICRDHTMCRITNPRPVCNAIVSSLTSGQRNEIVNVHNEFRRRVASGNERRGSPGPQPAARNMPNLVWDTELATIAQRWANQCRFNLAHDSCRNVRRFNVGQNIATLWSTGSNPSSLRTLITLWYDEVRLFNRNQVDRFVFNAAISHYTQIVWAATTRIGCGYVNSMNGNRNTVLLVCNYGPGGNVRGRRIYERR